MQIQDWYEKGWTPIPLVLGTKKPVVRWRAWQDRQPPKFLVDQWFAGGPRNLGLILPEHAVVVDFDEEKVFAEWFKSHDIDTFMAQTARGVHVYLYVGEKPPLTCKMAGGDIKSTGYVVAPNSIHPSGARYKVLRDTPIAYVENLEDIGITPQLNQFETGEDRRRVVVPGMTIVQKLNSYLDVVRLLIENGVNLHRRGQRLVANCPFHDDRNPSMAVYEDENTVYCFSTACRAHRRIDALGLFAMLNGLDSREAIQILARYVE